MSEINISDLFTPETTAVESQPEVGIDISDLKEPETTEEVNEEPVETVEEVEETLETTEDTEEARNYDDIVIKWDDEETLLSSYDDHEIQKLIGLGLKTKDKIEKAQREASDTVSDFGNIAGLYNMDTNGLMEFLLNQGLEGIAEESGRHIDDVRKEYNSNHKSFRERNVNKLLDEYPDLTADTIPKEVMDKAGLGNDLKTEYRNFKLNEENNELKEQIAKLEKQIKVSKQNEKSKKKAIVTKNTGGTSNQQASILNKIDNILKR